MILNRFLLTSLIATSLGAFASTEPRFTNLNFDKADDNKPVGWSLFYGSQGQLSHIFERQQGVAVLESEGEYTAFEQSFNHSFAGKEITLTGRIKTKDVTESAVLWMRLDDEVGKMVSYQNTESDPIAGNQPWRTISLTLSLDNDAHSVSLGGMVMGKGTAWFDDFVLTVDGKDAKQVKLKAKPVYLADQDVRYRTKSGVAPFNPTTMQLANLKMLAKVWGFVKYYHPHVASGQHNMDAKLFDLMPKIIAAKTKPKAQQAMSDWIDELGVITPCETACVKRDKAASIKLDTNWLSDQQLLGARLSKQLADVFNHRSNLAKHYYFAAGGAGNVMVKNEYDYQGIAHQDTGFRLLALFRVWNFIEYFAPYKPLTDRDWSEVLSTHLASFIEAKDDSAYHLALLGLLAEMDDSHTGLSSPNKQVMAQLFGEYALPIKLKKVQGQWVVVDVLPQYASSISKGSIVTHIAHKALNEYEIELAPLIHGSNEATLHRNMASKLVRVVDKTAAITLKNAQSFTLPAMTINERNDGFQKLEEAQKPYQLIDKEIGYFNLATLTASDVASAMALFENTKGLIIDIRNYPRGTAWELIKYLYPQKTVFARFESPSMTTPGDFILSDGYALGEENPDHYKGKIVLLANEESQSQSEFSLMMLRKAPNAIVIGSQTAGADGNVSAISIPGGHKTWISGISVLTPSKGATQRVGIIPDIEVKPTIKSVSQGEDLVLDKAISLLKSPRQFAALLPSKVQL